MIKDDDLDYIKANTPNPHYVEYVNTGIDNNGRWFTRSSTVGDYKDEIKAAKEFKSVLDAAVKELPLPITVYWVNERSDCFIICGPDGAIPGKYDTAEDALRVCELLNEDTKP